MSLKKHFQGWKDGQEVKSIAYSDFWLRNQSVLTKEPDGIPGPHTVGHNHVWLQIQHPTRPPWTADMHLVHRHIFRTNTYIPS